jgi:glycerol-3-phosphate acyltransferase PlsY
MSGVDVRKEGSGNIGMTNVARSVGGKAAALTFVCDVGKGVLCMVLMRFVVAQLCFGGDMGMLVHNGPFAWVMTTFFAACVMGHVFSPYLHFHGGKGIAVGLGASLGLYWPLGLGMLALFLLLVIPTHYISLGSIAAAASLPFLGLFFGISGVALIPVALVAVVVIWSHRENIGRLIRGEEHGFSIKHKKDGE